MALEGQVLGVLTQETGDILDLLFDNAEGILNSEAVHLNNIFFGHKSSHSANNNSTSSHDLNHDTSILNEISPHNDSGYSETETYDYSIFSSGSDDGLQFLTNQFSDQHANMQNNEIQMDISNFDVNSFIDELEAGVCDTNVPLETEVFIEHCSSSDDSRYTMEVGQEVQVRSSCGLKEFTTAEKLSRTPIASSRKRNHRGQSLPYSLKDLDPNYFEDNLNTTNDSLFFEDVDVDETVFEGVPGDKLVLSVEEKRILENEGLTLPSHLPLTREEERILKMVRRKIRNKISAKNSRLKKQEYVAGLERRVKTCTHENQRLHKVMDRIAKENMALRNRLQVALSRLGERMSNNGSKATTVGGTCFFVLLLSFVAFVGPQTKFWDRPDDLYDDAVALNDNQKISSARTLLQQYEISQADEQEFSSKRENFREVKPRQAFVLTSNFLEENNNHHNDSIEEFKRVDEELGENDVTSSNNNNNNRNNEEENREL